jgi:hypothetical protein
LLGFGWGEKARIRCPVEKRRKDTLRLRTQGYLLVVTPPAILMVKGFVDPDLASGVEVAWPHDD